MGSVNVMTSRPERVVVLIQKVRRAAGLDNGQRAIAADLGVSQAAISHWVRGRSGMDEVTRRRIAAAIERWSAQAERRES